MIDHIRGAHLESFFFRQLLLELPLESVRKVVHEGRVEDVLAKVDSDRDPLLVRKLAKGQEIAVANHLVSVVGKAIED